MKLWPVTKNCLEIIERIGGHDQEAVANYCIVSWFALRLPQLVGSLELDMGDSERRKLTDLAQSLAERQTLAAERVSTLQRTENLSEWELAVLSELVGFLRLRLDDLIDASSVSALQHARDHIHEELLKRHREPRA